MFSCFHHVASFFCLLLTSSIRTPPPKAPTTTLPLPHDLPVLFGGSEGMMSPEAHGMDSSLGGEGGWGEDNKDGC